MAIPKLKKEPNGYYYVTWSENRRTKRESTGTKEVRAAQAYLGQFLLNNATVIETPDDAFTIAELWTAYDAKHIEHVAAPDGIRYAWNNLAVHFGDMTPSQVDQKSVDAYERLRTEGKIGGKPVKPSTVRKELVMLRAGLNWCSHPSRKMFDAAVLQHFKLPAEGDARDRWLRHEEIQRLLSAAVSLRKDPDKIGRGELFLWLALETAARKSALLELTWDRVDFETNVIHLNVPGRRVTKKRRADVPISKALRPVLERAYQERDKASPTGLVHGHEGEIWATVQSIADRAGFGDPDRAPRRTGTKPKGTGISPHVLRHTAATHMARRGVPLWIIAKILANTLAMVEKVYAKHCPDDLRAAVDTISGGILEPTR